MAALLERFSQKRAEARANSEHHQALVSLDFSQGIPLDMNLIQLADESESRLGSYIRSMAIISRKMRLVQGHAQDIFFGKKLDDVRITESFRSSEDWPPKENYGVDLYGSLAISRNDRDLVVKHLVQLAAYNSGITEREKQESLVNQAIQSRKDSRGWSDSVEIGDWKLYCNVDRNDNWMEVRMYPVEKPEYQKEWRKMHLTEVERHTSLESVIDAMREATSENYMKGRTGMGNGSVFKLIDIGSVKDLKRSLQKSGWSLVERKGRHSDAEEIYKNKDGEITDPLLEVNYEDKETKSGSFYFSAIATPEYIDKARSEFYVKFSEQASHVLEGMIERAKTSDETVVLRSSDVIYHTFSKMEHKLESYHSHEELPILGKIVAQHLSSSLSEYPAFGEEVARLQDLLKLSEFESNHTEDSINFGWRPELVKINVKASDLVKSSL